MFNKRSSLARAEAHGHTTEAGTVRAPAPEGCARLDAGLSQRALTAAPSEDPCREWTW